MNKIKYNKDIAEFFSYNYMKTEYRRWWDSVLVNKHEILFDITNDNQMILSPNAIPILYYSWFKKYLNNITLPSISKTNLLDIKYSWSPTTEQQSILSVIKERSDKYKYNWWLIIMKTWRWKSHIICQILDFYKKKTLISVHNIKTLFEMKDKIWSFLQWTYKLWTFFWQSKILWDIVITTHTSLNKANWRIVINWEEFKPEILLYDEADRNVSETMIKTFCNMKVKWMYWLTWTPNSKNLKEKDLCKIFWKAISSKQWWYNVIPVVKYIKYRTSEDYDFSNYAELRQCLTDDKDRFNDQIKYIKHIMKYRKYWLLLSDRVEEVENFYEALKDLDFNVILIHGWTDVKVDEKKISESSWKKTLIIWTSWKMSRWVDIPEIDTVFLFYPNKFESATIQAVWRWLRNCEWKTNTLLVDWADYPILKNQLYNRWKTYRSEYNIPITKENEAKSI